MPDTKLISTDSLIPSATVILLRDHARQLQVLMLKKAKGISYGGSWVFPGGRIDQTDRIVDRDALATERQTASRECLEETGIDVAPRNMTPISRWITPAIRAKRFNTVFFLTLAPNPNQSIQIDNGEIVESRWFTPAEAMERHQAKQILLNGPAFVTLHQLASFADARTAHSHYQQTQLAQYLPKVFLTAQGAISLYQDDDAYSLLGAAADQTEPADNQANILSDIQAATRQHRLLMSKNKPWQYIFNIDN